MRRLMILKATSVSVVVMIITAMPPFNESAPELVGVLPEPITIPISQTSKERRSPDTRSLRPWLKVRTITGISE